MNKILFAVLLLPFYCRAQHFSYTAKVAPVLKEDFYRIRVNPQIAGYAQSSLQDLRLMDNKGMELPYFLHRETTGREQLDFKAFPFLLSADRKQLVVTVENQDKQMIDHLLFTIRNAEVSRTARVNGSDDKRKWYIVRDSFTFQSQGKGTSLAQKIALTFPRSDYRYYQIIFNHDNTELPLNIINIGLNNSSALPSAYQAIPQFDFRVRDSGKFTIIRCPICPGTRVDLLRFDIDGPETYQRAITAIFYPKRIRGTGSFSSLPITRFIEEALSSRKAGEIDCSDLPEAILCDSIHILIDNKDDAPLRIRSLKAFQFTTTITAKLKPGKDYFLYFGDSTLKAPEYDIVYFRESVTPANTVLETGNITSKVQARETDNKRGKMLLWIGLALAGGILLLLTLNITTKMKPK